MVLFCAVVVMLSSVQAQPTSIAAIPILLSIRHSILHKNLAFSADIPAIGQNSPFRGIGKGGRNATFISAITFHPKTAAMKTFVLILLLLAGSLYTQSQTIDSLDNLVLKIPAGWEVEKYQGYTLVTKRNKSTNSFCQLAIYGQQPASGDHYASFKSEWDGLLLGFFETSDTPVPQMRKTKQGNALFYGAQVTNKTNGLRYYTELHVYDCGNYVQSVLVTYGAKKHVGLYDSLWKPIIAVVKRNSANVQPVAGNTSSSNPFNGKWSSSGSSLRDFSPGSILTDAGYYKNMYDFRPDGTYTLRGESRTNTGNYILIDENGSYKINGTQLIITPAKGKIQTFDRDGKLLRSQVGELAKRSYTWQLHYFEGLDETQLVLTPARSYTWDGGTGGSSLFPNSVLLSQKTTIEWRFK
jgi:hypothetical protein